MNIMKRENPFAYLDILRAFEAVKKTVDIQTTDKVTMTFPRVMLDEMCKEHLGEDFANILNQSTLIDQLTLQYDK